MRHPLRLAAAALLLLLGSLPAAAEHAWGVEDAERPRRPAAELPALLAAAEVAIDQDPRDAAAYRHAIAILATMARYPEAEGPLAQGANWHLAHEINEQRRWQQALTLARRWSAALPGEESLLRLATMLADGAEAEATFRRLLRHAPESVAGHAALAALLRRDGRPGEAEALLVELLSRRPGDPAAHRALVEHFSEEALPVREREAIAAWQARFPDDPEPLHALLLGFADELPAAEATRLAHRALAAPPPNRGPDHGERFALRRLCTALVRAELPAVAESCWRRAIAEAPGDGPARAELVKLLAAGERWAEVDELLAGLRGKERASLAGPLVDRALELARQGHCPAALAAVARAEAARGDHHEPGYELGGRVAALARCGEEQRAAAEIARSIRPDWRSRLGRVEELPSEGPAIEAAAAALAALLPAEPAQSEAWAVLDQILEQQGPAREQRRVDHLLTWAALVEGDATPLFTLAGILERSGNAPAAAAALAEGLQRETGSTMRWVELVELQLAAGRLAEAQRAVERAAAIDAGLGELLRGKVATARGDWAGAAALLRAYLEVTPPADWWPEAERSLLDAWRQLGDLGALTAWLEASANDPEVRRTAGRGSGRDLYLGQRWADLELDDRALLHLEAALAVNPNDRRTLHRLAALLERTGRPGEAEAMFRRALALAPLSDCNVLPIAAFLRRAGDPEGAVAVLRPLAATRDPGSYVLTELGRSLLAAGSTQEALDLLAPVAEASPEAYLAHYYSGEALAALGRAEEADGAFRTFLAHTAPLAGERGGCNCSCEVLQLRAALLARRPELDAAR